MITSWAPLSDSHSPGGAAAMVEYLDASQVRKRVSGSYVDLARDPAPERLLGQPDLVAAVIDRVPFKRSFQLVTLSFAATDIPVPEFNGGTGGHRERAGQILRLFLETAAPGIPPALRPPGFVNTHTHTGRLEVNIMVPGMVLRPCGQVMAFNPNPPGRASRRRWDAFTDTVNGRYGFADPRGLDHMRLVGYPDLHLKLAAEARRHGARETHEDASAIVSEALLLYDCDGVDKREDLLSALLPTILERGLDVVDIADNGVTFARSGAPRFALRGHLFSAGFDPGNPLNDLTEARDLRADELAKAPDRLRGEIELCAAFNRERYWCDHPLPHPLDILHGPPLSLPPRHPGSPAGKAMTPVLSRLVAVMTAVFERAREALQCAQILRAFKAADFRFTKLRYQLETLNDRYPTAPRHHGTARHQPDLGGSDRTLADDPRNGTGTGDRRPAGHPDLRPRRDPRSDAAGGGHHGTGAVSSGGGPGAGGADGECDDGDAGRHHAAEGVVRRAPSGSRADVLIRLRRGAKAMPENAALALRGTGDGRVHITGPGFNAIVGGDNVRDAQACDEESVTRLNALLTATGLPPLPEEDQEVALDFG